MMKITFNGQTYTGVDEMPSEVRREYERVLAALADRDGDGFPDLDPNALAPGDRPDDGVAVTNRVDVTTTRLFVNGEEYADVADMPPEARVLYERLLRQTPDRDGDGFPDLPGADDTSGSASVSRETTRRVIISGPRSLDSRGPGSGRGGLELHILGSPRRMFPLLAAIGLLALVLSLVLLA